MSTIDEIEREIAKVKLLNDMSDGMTAPRSTRVLELAAIELTAANERIRELKAGNLVLVDALTAEREVSDNLEKALEYVLGPKDDEKIGWRGVGHADLDQFRCEFCAKMHEDVTLIAHLDDCPITAARAALAEVAHIRSQEVAAT